MNSILTFILYVCLLQPSFGGATYGDLNDKHQAMYLFNLVRNIDWSMDRVVIGVVGETPVMEELEKLAAKNPKVEIRALNGFAAVNDCQIVFLPNSSNRDFYQVQTQIGSDPILLVVDKKQYVAMGAEMGFYLEEEKLKFVVNNAALDETGIKVSHTLLERAKPMD